ALPIYQRRGDHAAEQGAPAKAGNARQHEGRQGAQRHRGDGGVEGDLQRAHHRPHQLGVVQQAGVPAHRPPAPHGHQSRVVEGVDDQDDHRQVDEGQPDPQHYVGEAPALHGLSSSSLAWLRLNRMMGISRMASMTTASDAATGQSRLLKNSCHSTLPIIRVSGPPSSSGITNSPTTGMNTSMQPAMMPLRDRGTVILQKLAMRPAPRSAAASSRVGSCLTRLAYSGSTMKGRYE